MRGFFRASFVNQRGFVASGESYVVGFNFQAVCLVDSAGLNGCALFRRARADTRSFLNRADGGIGILIDARIDIFLIFLARFSLRRERARVLTEV